MKILKKITLGLIATAALALPMGANNAQAAGAEQSTPLAGQLVDVLHGLVAQGAQGGLAWRVQCARGAWPTEQVIAGRLEGLLRQAGRPKGQPAAITAE